MTTQDTQTEALAREFCRVLNHWLSPAQIGEINRRNAANENKSVCASHDYCDANQAMLDAMDVLGIEFNDDSHDLINRAWEIARKRGFAK